MLKRFDFILSIVLLIVSAEIVSAETVFIWHGDFSTSEKEKLVRWQKEVEEVVGEKLGPYSFDVEVNMYRRDGEREPVPWANTWRYPGQSLHFYVDPSYSLGDFQEDWTAVHEWAHLALPYLGEEHKWFAEGFASYLQYPLLAAQGMMDSAEVVEILAERRDRSLDRFKHQKSFVDEVADQQERHDYSSLYWGGACYFILVEEALRKQGSDLCQAIRNYQASGRTEDRSFEEVMRSLDRVSGEEKVFSELYQRFQRETLKELLSGV